MAIIPKNEYVGRIDDTDVDFPQGKAQNLQGAVVGTGTPIEEKWVNDLFGWEQAILDEAGITPSGVADRVGASDYLDGLKVVFNRDFDTVVEAKAAVLKEGQVVRIKERGNALFDVISGTAGANGYNIIAHDTLNLSFVLRVGRVTKAVWWGAKTDGDFTGATGVGTDNGVILQAALDYLNSTYGGAGPFKDGGHLVLEAGTYETTTGITLYPNITISGSGIDLTEIQNQAGNSASITLINIPDYGMDASERIGRNILLSGLSVNGNDNNTTGTVKNVSFNNVIYCNLQNVEFKQSEGRNLEIIGSSNISWSNVLLRDGNDSQLILEDCANMTIGASVTIRTGNDWGVYITGLKSERISFVGTRFAASQKGGVFCDNASTDITIKACDFVEGGSSGFGALSSAIRTSNNLSTGWTIEGCTFARTFGTPINLASDVASIGNNTINSCRFDGIISTGSDVTINGNTIIDAGYLTDNTYDGIRVTGGRSTVNDNKILFLNDVGGSGQKVRYGINMDTGSNNSSLYENEIGSTATATEPLNIVPSSVISYKNKGGANQLAFVVAGMSADQTGIGSTTTVVEFDTEAKDFQGDFDLVAFKFTAPADGWYRMNLALDTQGLSGASVDASVTSVITKIENITTTVAIFNIQQGAFTGTMPISGLLQMDKNDEAQVKVQFVGDTSGTNEINDRSYWNIERADM